MPQHYNSVNLLGNLTAAPELRYTPNNTAVAEFGLAVNNRYSENDDDTLFIDVTTWGKEAENGNEYLEKGQSVFVEGELQLDQWEDDSGQKHSKHSINADNVIYLHSSTNTEEPDNDVQEQEDDEIPF